MFYKIHWNTHHQYDEQAVWCNTMIYVSGEYSQNQCAVGDPLCDPCPERLPSCIGKTDGAKPFTGREWTDNYMECYKNRTMALNKCPTGSVFDIYEASCVSKIDKSE